MSDAKSNHKSGTTRSRVYFIVANHTPSSLLRLHETMLLIFLLYTTYTLVFHSTAQQQVPLLISQSTYDLKKRPFLSNIVVFDRLSFCSWVHLMIFHAVHLENIRCVKIRSSADNDEKFWHTIPRKLFSCFASTELREKTFSLNFLVTIRFSGIGLIILW